MTNRHPFASYVNEKTFQNPALLEAWQEYRPFIEEAKFSDVTNKGHQADAYSVDEVRRNFESSVPAQHNAFESSEESLKYIYQSEETMPESANHYTATVYFHFVDRRLLYSEIRIQVDSDLEKRFMSNEDKARLLAEDASIEELADLQPQTFGLAQMLMDGEMTYELYVPYLDDEGVEHAEFFVIRDGHIQVGYTNPLAKEFQAKQNNLLRNLLAYEQILRRRQSDEAIADHISDVDHLLDDFVSGETLENPASRLAFQYYKEIEDQFGLANFNVDHMEGPSPSEVANTFTGQAPPTHIISSDHEEYLIYLFESEIVNPATEKPRQAELKLYFYDKVLTYADIFGLDSYFYEGELVEYDEGLKQFTKGTVLEKFEKIQPITMGLAQFVYQGDSYTILMTPQMQGDSMVLVNYVFIEDVMHYAFATEYAEIKDNLRNAMTQVFMNLTSEGA